MADKKISQLPLKSPAEDTDYVPIVDASTGETKRAYRSDFLGPQGPQGVAGPTGPIGPTGPTGPAGPKGADGSSFQIKGQVDTVEELPSEDNTSGDGYFVGVDKELYYWSVDDEWINYGPLRGLVGPQGPQGVKGDTGADGADGAIGPKGDKGDTGATGPKGDKGEKGDKGDTGPAGTDGKSLVDKGEYNAETTYVNTATECDWVTYNGSSYYAKQETKGNLPTNTTYWGILAQKGTDGAGAGDMVASVYDPEEVEGDVFDMDNMAQGTTNKFISAAELTVLQNTSGINTGDQESSDFDIKDLTDSNDLRTTWSGKQDALGYTPEDSANKRSTFQATPTDTAYPTEKLVKDSLDAKMSNPMTTAGDIIYGGASGVATRLAKGDDGKVLMLKSGLPSWETPASGGADIIEVQMFS